MRRLFTRESVLASDWYTARLDAKQRNDQARSARGVAALEDFLHRPGDDAVSRDSASTSGSRRLVPTSLVRSEAYRAGLVGTISVPPLEG